MTRSHVVGMGDGFLRALLEADRATAIDIARRALREGGLPHVCEELIVPALVEVGVLWEQNRLTMADGYLAAAAAQTTLAALYPFVEWPPRGGPKALVACVPGNHHQLASRMVADLLALDGWDDVYVGGDPPVEAISDKAREQSVALVALSVSLPAQLPALRVALRAVREAAPRAKILVGGRGLGEMADARELGVDAVAASASGGVDAARRFKP